MRGYDSTSYGDGFADVYDDWYAQVTDVDATVALVSSLLPSDQGSAGRVLELGAGTGRLAVPIADRGADVTAVDSSTRMLDQLAARLATDPISGSGSVDVVLGDMVDDLPDGPFDVALVAYNTLFNLLDADRQRHCFEAVARRLAPTGWFVVEAIVPDPEAPPGTAVGLRSMTTDRVVLSVTDHRPDEQRTDGQFVEFTEAGGVRLRPWAIRWCDVDELDAMATSAGLVLHRRTRDMSGAAFDADSDTHVSIYRRRT